MEKFPFQLLSCTESAGIKLPILPAHWETSFTGICKGKRESPTVFLPWQQRGPLGTWHSRVTQSSLAAALSWPEKRGIKVATGQLSMNQAHV